MKCVICGKNFIPNPRAHGQKYCGRQCYLEANNKNKHAQTKVADKPIRKIKRPPTDDYLPIPQAPRYEINSRGFVRNTKTGKHLKWMRAGRNRNSKQMNVYTNDGKKISVTLPNLLWLIHGIVVGKKAPIPVSVTKGTRYLRFDSSHQAALFLADITKTPFSTCRAWLFYRKQTVADWQINYLPC